MGKTITFTMNAKDVKTVMAAAEILKGALTPATEPVIAVIEEAPAKPTKKAAVKKDVTAKTAKKETKKAKKATTKNRSANMAMISSLNRMVITTNTLDKANLFGHRVNILQNGNKNEFLMTDAKAKIPAQYKVVKTIDLPYGEAVIGVKRYLGTVYQGQKIRVSVTGNTIKFMK